MSGHTPGPWTYSIDLKSDGSGEHFDLSSPSINSFLWSCGCCGGTNIDGPNAKADASLICAAPDLLAALENITGAAKAGMPAAYMRSVIRDAEIAIAKARGDL